MDKPSITLAKCVMDRLVEEGLFTEVEAEKTRSAVASGKMSQEDWQLSIELTMEEQQRAES